MEEDSYSGIWQGVDISFEFLVKKGKLTQDEADQLSEELEKEIEKEIDDSL